MTRNDFNKSQNNIAAKSKRDSKKRLTALPSVSRIKMLIKTKDKKSMQAFPKFEEEHNA